MTRYDAAVIGAGLGGLTAAAVLARAGRKVLVIERSNSVGGAASSYKAGDLFVEGSLHETSNPHDASDPKHDVLVRAGVLEAVGWVPAGAFYEVRGGPMQKPLVVPDRLTAARDAIAARFPRHRAAIDQLLDEMQVAALDPLPDAGDMTLSLAARLDRAFGDDEAVKCALAANLSYYHDDPATLPWRAFAQAQGRYFLSGGCFIHGGSQRLSSALARAIRAAGGHVLLRRVAIAIAFDADGRPLKVIHTARDGGDPRAVNCARVIVNAAPTAVTAMLPDAQASAWANTYASRPPSISLFMLTLGLSEPATRFGLTRYSTQLLPDWMDRLSDYAAATRLMAEAPRGRMPPLAIANYAAIDSGVPAPPHVVSITGPDHIDNWQEPAIEDYRARRTEWQRALIDYLDTHYPGLAGAVAAASFNTARSVESYLGAPRGAVYGFAPASGPGSPRAPLNGVYLASAYAGSGGYTGAIVAGGACADMVLNDT